MLRPEDLSEPTHLSASELIGWRPPHGVVSIYVNADPGDRSQPWRIELKNGLSEALKRVEESDDDRETKLAVRATAEWLASEFDREQNLEARGLLGFVEAGRDREAAEQRWYATQLAPRRTHAAHGPVAELHLLLALLDEGQPLGAAVIAKDRVRLLDWRLGVLEEVHDWELEYFGDDWRERKSKRPGTGRAGDKRGGSATSSSGRDQQDQRMDATFEKFAQQTGGLAGGEAAKREWRELLLFGDQRYTRHFEEALNGLECRQVDSADLISTPQADLERRLEDAVIPNLNREREAALINQIKQKGLAEGRGALGVQETLQALAEGRVEHLVYDAERDFGELDVEPDGQGGEAREMPAVERMIELALSTSAKITPVEGANATALDEQDGAAALLRY